MYNQEMRSGNIIIFFVPPEKIVNGGVMSIFSQAKESRRFKNIHNSEVIVCTYPGHPTYEKNDLFENTEKVYSFEQVIEGWENPKKILLQIPETAVIRISKVLQTTYKSYLDSAQELRINVMTQNIKLMPAPQDFFELFRISSAITQTTAHTRYTTQALSDSYKTPVHHLSVFVDKGQYQPRAYAEKENLIVYSPDTPPEKDKILAKLSALSGFRIQEIRNMTYSQYKETIARAKFCISFGEGFDGYFVEGFLSGAIGMAVYNDEFFPDKTFSTLPSVFSNYDVMERTLRETIQSLDDTASFEQCVKKGVAKIEKLYTYDAYIAKIKAFYEGSYDIMPHEDRPLDALLELLKKKDLELESYSKTEHELRDKIKKLADQLNRSVAEREHAQKELENILNSRSWKATKPLRTASKAIRKKA